VEEAGEQVAIAAHTGTTEETITVNIAQNPNVEAYYLKITGATASVSSGYSLDISYDSAGDTGPTARDLNDPLDNFAFGTRSVEEELDNVIDFVDVYRFFMDGRVPSGQFAARLVTGNPSSYHVDLLQDANNNFGTATLLTTSHRVDGQMVVAPRTLSGGPFFFIRVLHSAPSTDNYTLTTQFDYAGATLATARNIHGVDSNLQSFSDEVGDTNVTALLDAADVIEFSVSSTQTVFAQVRLRNASPASFNVTASLIFDANNNGVIDTGETLATATTSPTAIRSAQHPYLLFSSKALRPRCINGATFRFRRWPGPYLRDVVSGDCTVELLRRRCVPAAAPSALHRTAIWAKHARANRPTSFL
jgi:hypothetical protein